MIFYNADVKLVRNDFFERLDKTVFRFNDFFFTNTLISIVKPNGTGEHVMINRRKMRDRKRGTGMNANT
jgi:hypothetical protein